MKIAVSVFLLFNVLESMKCCIFFVTLQLLCNCENGLRFGIIKNKFLLCLWLASLLQLRN